ncbi:MAG: ral secretion pathway protein [Verrucomicrobiota bacterium]|jgi:general secretion pathway protein K
MDAFRQNRRRGAALMLSLWALFLLSAMVISWALDIDSRLVLSGYANRNLEALALACSGVEVAMCPSPPTKPDSPALVGGFGKDQRYEARITGEGGRLNINWLIQGENPARLEILRRYLEIKGVDLNERDQMIDTLLDWVDPDNLARLNGAEEEPGYKPPNKQKLDRIDELKKIRGWQEFTSAKDWDTDLTLSSTGPIDIAWASRDVLMALPGASEDRVDQYLAMRSGSDEIDGTEDDPFFGANQTQAFAVLGIPPQQLTGLIGPDQVMRVTSVGKSGDITRTVRAVFKIGNLKSWKEL